MAQMRAAFRGGCPPRLLYATKQMTGGPKINRSIHSHHDCTELLYVYRGEGTYIADGYSYEIQPGDLLLYNQGDLHEVTSLTSHEIGTYCFGMTGLCLTNYPDGHMSDASAGFVRPAGGQAMEIEALCKLIYEKVGRGTPEMQEVVQYLLPALVLLAVNLPADERSRNQSTDVVLANRIRQYIGTHFREPLTLEEIGEALHVSPYYAGHVFKEITGVSPIQYVIRCRIGAAQNLLIASDYSATQIAAMVGYTSVNHFNSIFTKMVGLPPIRYRKQYLETMQGKRTQ